MEKITVEYCIGVGYNMLFPEYVKHTFFIESDDDDDGFNYLDLKPNPPIDLLISENQ